jgi:hypothetical protein
MYAGYAFGRAMNEALKGKQQAPQQKTGSTGTTCLVSLMAKQGAMAATKDMMDMIVLATEVTPQDYTLKRLAAGIGISMITMMATARINTAF